MLDYGTVRSVGSRFGGQGEPDIRLERVTKRFGDMTAVDALDLEMPRGAFYALLGPVRLRQDDDAADDRRLRGPDRGPRLPRRRGRHRAPAVQARRQHGLPVLRAVPAPERRAQRRASGSSGSKVGKDEVRKRVAEALELVQLGNFGKRKPGQLSGGQAQRVALARALVNRPRALLLDEPLGALDLRLRKQLQIELKRIQQDVGITFVHVTHDQEEAMSMADTIAVMHDGKIEQAGGAADLYERPRTEFVANFLGVSNLIDGKLGAAQGSARHRRDARRRAPARPVRPRRPARHRLDPRRRAAREDHAARARQRRAPDGDDNSLRGTVVVAAFLGTSIQYVVKRAGGEELTVFAQNLDGSEPDSFGPGREVRLTWDPHHTFVVAKEQTT